MRYFNLFLLVFLVLVSCDSNVAENGLIVKNSPYEVEITYNKLRTIIENNPNLKILLELDHTNNAASVDLQLPPTKIIMFGNPKLGTPLMQSSATTSIDLPQKIIVYSDDNLVTKIAYNDPLYLKERHNVEGKDDVIQKVSAALDNITNKAISK